MLVKVGRARLRSSSPGWQVQQVSRGVTSRQRRRRVTIVLERSDVDASQASNLLGPLLGLFILLNLFVGRLCLLHGGRGGGQDATPPTAPSTLLLQFLLLLDRPLPLCVVQLGAGCARGEAGLEAPGAVIGLAASRCGLVVASSGRRGRGTLDAGAILEARGMWARGGLL